MRRAFSKLILWLSDKLDGSHAHELARSKAETEMVTKRLTAAYDQLNDLLSPLPIPADAPWTPEASAGLLSYLNTPSGIALSNRLRLVAAVTAINGAQNTTNTVHAAGMSAGWNEAVRYVLSLSRVSRVEDTKPNDERPKGESDLLEQLSP